jgi:hypothetical protein
MLSATYGPQSPQLTAYNTALAQIAKSANNASDALFHQVGYARSVVQNTMIEIDNGLITNVRVQVTGEILAELVRLGKEAADERTDAAKNVAAVLIAAAFEDLMRRMGSELAAVVGRPKLEDVINALKDAGVLKGAEVGTAQSYLNFRNRSLHADWANVDSSVVESCTAFIEALLVKHLS